MNLLHCVPLKTTLGALHVARKLGSIDLEQGSPNYGPQAAFGLKSHFIRPVKPFCQ